MTEGRRHPAEFLEELAVALGLRRDAWGDAETCDVAQLIEQPVDANVFDDDLFDLLGRARKALGEALRWKLVATDVVRFTESDFGSSERVDEFRAEVDALGGDITIWFHVDKSRWWDTVHEESVTRTFWFVRDETLERILRESVSRVESELFAQGDAVVLVPRRDGIDLAGASLRIVSWSRAGDDDWTPSEAPSFNRMRSRVVWYRSYLERVTPFHFAVEGESSSTVLSGELSRLFLEAFILFVADATHGEEPVLRSTVEGGTGSVRFEHSALREGDLSTEAAREGIDALARLLDWIWCEERLDTDRLVYTQTILVNELQPVDPEMLWSELLRRGERIEQLARRRWKSFIEDKLHAHEAMVQRQMDAAGQAAENYTEEVSNILRGLAEAAVGAASVFVATWIAMVGKVDVTADFLRVVVAVYAVYLAIFPLGLKTYAAMSRARLVERTHARRREHFVAVVGEDEARQVEDGLVEDARSRLSSWIWVAVVVHLLLIAASVAGAVYAPEVLPGEQKSVETLEP